MVRVTILILRAYAMKDHQQSLKLIRFQLSSHGTEAPTAWIKLGNILQFLAGGCIFYCLLAVSRPGERRDDGADGLEGTATSATWRPVLDGGRSTKEAAGQLAAARPWLFGGSRADAISNMKAGRHQRVADIMRQRVDGAIMRRSALRPAGASTC